MADFLTDPEVLRFLQEAPFAIWETVYATLLATALSMKTDRRINPTESRRRKRK